MANVTFTGELRPNRRRGDLPIMEVVPETEKYKSVYVYEFSKENLTLPVRSEDDLAFFKKHSKQYKIDDGKK